MHCKVYCLSLLVQTAALPGDEAGGAIEAAASGEGSGEENLSSDRAEKHSAVGRVKH